MPDLIVTRHAMDRYRQRVEKVPCGEIRPYLTGPTFQLAADFGARYVRFARGQRAVIKDHKVITILPRDHAPGSLHPARDHLFEDGESHA